MKMKERKHIRGYLERMGGMKEFPKGEDCGDGFMSVDICQNVSELYFKHLFKCELI